MGTNGAFESISNVTLTEADTPGHVEYVFATAFDKGTGHRHHHVAA